LISAFLGIVGKGLYDSKFKKIDEAQRIREELRGQVDKLQKIFDEFQGLKVKYASLDIACQRCLSRLEECVGFISMLLDADQCLSEHNVKRARILLQMVERDKDMRERLEGVEK
jgi:hypothetical protein